MMISTYILFKDLFYFSQMLFGWRKDFLHPCKKIRISKGSGIIYKPTKLIVAAVGCRQAGSVLQLSLLAHASSDHHASAHHPAYLLPESANLRLEQAPLHFHLLFHLHFTSFPSSYRRMLLVLCLCQHMLIFVRQIQSSISKLNVKVYVEWSILRLDSYHASWRHRLWNFLWSLLNLCPAISCWAIQDILNSLVTLMSIW